MLTTQAAVLREAGALLAIETLEVLPPGPGEVLVRLGASGICGTDYSNAKAQTAKTPIVLGHEGAGVIEQVGEHVTHCRIGDHVVLSLISQCGVCRWCVNEQPHLCEPGTVAQRAGTLADGHSKLRRDGEEIYQFLGLGTFSERITVAQTAVVPIPKHIPLPVAALLGCGVLTGLGAALRSAPVPRGGTVLVIGCGGVGMNIIQGARLAGARRIIAIDPVASKGEIAIRLGATDFATPDEMTAIVAETTDGIGVDVAFDVVGAAGTTRAAIDATRRGGQGCIVGAKADAEFTVSAVVDLIRNAKTICGCNYGSSHVLRDIPQAVAALSTGALDLETMITNRIGLADINDAMALIASGEGLRSVIEY